MLKIKKNMIISYWQNYIDQDKGGVAIEFAFLAVPLTYILFGLIEISLLFTASGLLEHGTSKAAREIRTGEFQEMSDDPETAFKDILCYNIQYLMDCDNLQYEVMSTSDFASADNIDIQFDEDGNFESRGFSLAGPNGVVLVRTIYRYPIKTPGFAAMFSDGPDGETRLFVSTNVIQVEPYKYNASST